ncbi:nuclease [Bacillus lacus]|uniref:Nuclease n=1 Tax=Metabacillus lacus TaxID=1983721 RepID=A0A7X2IYS0_9BACI|nr:thermonuclease family protein [Metabacillus lacus]MRX72270.1 nuclease [Metabacillus lacus]
MWKKLLAVLLSTLLLSACSINLAEELRQTSADKQGTQKHIPAEVVRVVDGDTVQVSINGRKETVRLLLIDTPETVHPSKPVEPFGPEASSFAKKHLEGKSIGLELDASERDKYGRLLAYVHVEGKMFNEMILEEGLARVAYVFAPNTRHVDRFYEIQKAAQKREAGLWSIENYAAADEKYSTDSETTACRIKGNVSSSGEKIYHLPGGQFYQVTKEEELFCSEEEAVKAGYRKSKR